MESNLSNPELVDLSEDEDNLEFNKFIVEDLKRKMLGEKFVR